MPGNRASVVLEIVPNDRLALLVRGRDVREPWPLAGTLDGGALEMIERPDGFAEAAVTDEDGEPMAIDGVVDDALERAGAVVNYDFHVTTMAPPSGPACSSRSTGLPYA